MQKRSRAGKMFGVDYCTCHIIIALSCSIFVIHFYKFLELPKEVCRSCTEKIDKLVPFCCQVSMPVVELLQQPRAFLY